MPHSSLTLQQLTRYLHLPEVQVRKLVDRGAIPCRRVNGELIFSQEEVHRWLEGRIGVSDESGLVWVESALDHSVPVGGVEELVTISELIPEGAIATPLLAKTRDSVIRSMIQLAVGTGLLWDGEAMLDAVKQREELHSTALESGVALLHSRRPLPGILGDTFIVLGKLSNGIPFGGGFNNLTDIFFLICSMEDRIHLRILTRLSRLLTYPDFLVKLRELEREDLIRKLLRTTELSILSSIKGD
ncbi:MAG: PTS sugar transporter subunit IIA [Planctomycetaceae bacterium]|jgi:PTS system nitrogen regulatory IIA component|nr:PTS sugar transporter subunit IIA [Planctomycetaceae bacterium]